ncbi:hypothetical protein [Micromonospora sp. NPDC005652]|uniref:hypothetical protein n=1 Tax=Micromonospora sp. NPDC005652 TaxID=3157046 RepID=UPI0033E4A8DD
MLDALTLAMACAYGTVVGAIIVGPLRPDRHLLGCAWALSVLLAGADRADGDWPMAIVWGLSGLLWASRLAESYEVSLYPARG